MRGFRYWRWLLDEVYVKINGEVLESYVTKTRDKAAALRFMRKAWKRHGRAEAIVTDGLKSYPAAMHELGNEARREVGRHANNRAENSHLPFRRRERAMQCFRQLTRRAASPTHYRISFQCTAQSTISWLRRPSGQPGTSSRRPSGPKASPLGRSGRVAKPHGLRCCAGKGAFDRQRTFRIRLTSPALSIENEVSPFFSNHDRGGIRIA